MIDIYIDDPEILDGLQRLRDRSANLSPALLKIGEKLKESSQQRFSSMTAPDGTQWATNKPSTLEHKHGSRPLTEEGTLGDTIDYQRLGDDGVQIGSPMEYSAMMQFGGTKAEFPHLWGDIPARPFLGISEQDKSDILAIIQRHLIS